jgi:hypothetical protein
LTKPLRELRLAWLVVALGALLAGCSSESSPGQGPVPEEVAPLPDHAAALFPSYDAATSAWTTMSAFQRGLIEDGEVSFADYEAAVLAFTQCVEEAGLSFLDEPAYNSGTRKFEFSIVIGETVADADAGDADTMNCATEYFSHVQALWNWNNAPTEAELQEADAAWRACMLDGGDDRDDVAAIPQWGTTAFDNWVYEHGKLEAQNPSADFPNWRRCLDVVRREFPTG